MKNTNSSKERKHLVFLGVILFIVWVAFELFNYTVTNAGLDQMLSGMSIAGVISYATILAISFCGIDLACVCVEYNIHNDKSANYLVAAWSLAAIMNALIHVFFITEVAGKNVNIVVAMIIALFVLGVRALIFGLTVWLGKKYILNQQPIVSHAVVFQRGSKTYHPKRPIS